MRPPPFLRAALALVTASLATGAAVLYSQTQTATAGTPAMAADAESKPASGGEPAAALRKAALDQLDEARDELLKLAGAMPAEKYTWRPSKGVRSVGEVYMHVANGNYLMPTF